jgi:hypothetical protein
VHGGPYNQAKAATQEQDKLLAEKTALIETVKRLNREVAKLEQFKRSLLQQLQDDEEDSSSGHVGTTGGWFLQATECATT